MRTLQYSRLPPGGAFLQCILTTSLHQGQGTQPTTLLPVADRKGCREPLHQQDTASVSWVTGWTDRVHQVASAAICCRGPP